MDEKKRIGRPPKAVSDERTRVPLGLRVSVKTKDQLYKIAMATGRSISQEAEGRLEQSFRDDRLERLLKKILDRLGESK